VHKCDVLNVTVVGEHFLVITGVAKIKCKKNNFNSLKILFLINFARLYVPAPDFIDPCPLKIHYCLVQHFNFIL
jgi:hypothetical protein